MRLKSKNRMAFIIPIILSWMILFSGSRMTATTEDTEVTTLALAVEEEQYTDINYDIQRVIVIENNKELIVELQEQKELLENENKNLLEQKKKLIKEKEKLEKENEELKKELR